MNRDELSIDDRRMNVSRNELPAAPYPGLRPYSQKETKLFSGRAKERLRLLRLLACADFLAVLGSSGSGKSSLVLSGLLPDIRAGRMRGGGDAGKEMQFAIFRPGGNPYSHLARALFETEWGKGLNLPDPYFIEKQLRTGQSALAGMLRGDQLDHALPGPPDSSEVWPDREVESPDVAGAPPMLLIVVDQFEEIFRFATLLPTEHETAGENERRDFLPVAGVLNEAQAFIDLLLTTVALLPGRVRVLITMRSDFFRHCETFRGLPEAISAHQFVTPRMAREQMQDAIELPLRHYGWTIDEAVVNELLNDLPAEFDQLPVLQHALARMWHHAIGETGRLSETERRITTSDYEAIKKLAGAMAYHGEKLLEAKTIQAAGAAGFFRCLGDFDPATGQAIRRPRTLAQIAEESGIDRDTVAKVARVFAPEEASFIICTPPLPDENEPTADNTIVDLSHECLLRKWDRFKEWMKLEQRQGEALQMLWRTKQADEHLSTLEMKVVAETAVSFRAQAWMDRYKVRIHDRVETPDAEILVRYLGKERWRRRAIRGAIVVAIACVLGLSIGLLAVRVQSAEREKKAAVKLLKVEEERAVAVKLKLEAEKKQADLNAQHANAAENQAAQIGGLTTRIRSLEAGTEDLTTIVSDLMKLPNSELDGLSPDSLALLRELGFVAEAAGSAEESSFVPRSIGGDLRLSSWRSDGFGSLSAVALTEGHSDGEIRMLIGGQRGFWELPVPLDKSGGISQRNVGTDLEAARLWSQSAGTISVSVLPESRGWYLVTNGGPDIGIRRGLDVAWETIGTRALTRQAGVTRAKLIPNGKIVFGTGDGQLGLLDANKPETPATLVKSDHKGIINDLSINPDGNLLVASGDDQIATLWQIKPDGNLALLSRVSCGAPVRSASFSPNGRWALVPSGEREIRLYLLSAKAPAFEQSRSISLPHNSPVLIGTFSPDGRWIATATTQGEVRIWRSVPDPSPAKAQPVCTVNTSQRPTALLWSPDSKLLATADAGGNVVVWQFQSGGVLGGVPNFLPSTTSAVDALAWSPDGGLLIYGNSEGSAQVRQVGSFTVASRLEDPLHSQRLRMANAILSTAMLEDSEENADTTVHRWIALLKEEGLDRDASELPATVVLDNTEMVRRWLIDSFNTQQKRVIPLDLEAVLRFLVVCYGSDWTAKLVQATLELEPDGIVGRSTTNSMLKAYDRDPDRYMWKLFEMTFSGPNSRLDIKDPIVTRSRFSTMLQAALSLRQIGVEEEALIERARSAIGKNTSFVLGKGGMDPLVLHPADNGECDASGFVAWVLGESRKSEDDFYVRELDGWMDVTRLQKDIQEEGGILKPCFPKPGCLAAYGSGEDSVRNIAIVTEVILSNGRLVPFKVIGCTRKNSRSGDAILEYSADDFVRDPTTVYGKLDLILNTTGKSLEAFLKDNRSRLRLMIQEANILARRSAVSPQIPLTESDAWLSIAAEAGLKNGMIDPDHVHSGGERGIMPLPLSLKDWFGDEAPRPDVLLTPDLNLRFWLRYLAILKNKDLTGPPQHLYRELFLHDGIGGNDERQAKLLAGVLHGYFYSGNYTDRLAPVSHLLEGYSRDLPLPKLLGGTTFRHAGSSSITEGRQRNLDQALSWLLDSK